MQLGSSCRHPITRLKNHKNPPQHSTPTKEDKVPTLQKQLAKTVPHMLHACLPCRQALVYSSNSFSESPTHPALQVAVLNLP
jgi:hypothetical protein